METKMVEYKRSCLYVYKKVLFRFPYVLIVNIIFVVGIIYLYKQL